MCYSSILTLQTRRVLWQTCSFNETERHTLLTNLRHQGIFELKMDNILKVSHKPICLEVAKFIKKSFDKRRDSFGSIKVYSLLLTLSFYIYLIV